MVTGGSLHDFGHRLGFAPGCPAQSSWSPSGEAGTTGEPRGTTDHAEKNVGKKRHENKGINGY